MKPASGHFKFSDTQSVFDHKWDMVLGSKCGKTEKLNNWRICENLVMKSIGFKHHELGGVSPSDIPTFNCNILLLFKDEIKLRK